jgi:hypothetical protein
MANKEQYRTVREFVKTSLKEVSLDSGVSTTGNCYEVAANYVMDNSLFSRGGLTQGMVLVHAEVTGQGPIEGLKYGHAWAEVGGIVIDNSNGNNIQLPVEVYYRMGQVGSNVYKYTPEEVRRWMIDSETYGPWELETESGY